MVYKVLESTAFVVQNAKHVMIDQKKIKQFVQTLLDTTFPHRLWEAPYDLSRLSPRDKAIFIFVLNAISFSYRDDYTQKWKVNYGDELFDGARAMIACLGRAIENGYPILDFSYLEHLSQQELASILSWKGKIPLLKERQKILNEIWSSMNKYFQWDIALFFEKSKHDAGIMLDNILLHFPSFLDIRIYWWKQIFFCKRAQLFISDVFQAFSWKGYGFIQNIDTITACADYKLPWVLRKHGILVYSSSLQEKIDSWVHLMEGSAEEIEIRAHTIRAIEFIKRYLQWYGMIVESFQINDYLWIESQKKHIHDVPYHLTRTTAY